MALVKVGARIPAHSLKYAAMGLGLSPNTSKTGLMRAALALFHGKTPEEAYELAMPPTPKPRRIMGGPEIIDIVGDVDESLAQLPSEIGKATAIRIGLAIARGWDREDAEEWAKMPRGRPRKDRAS